MYMSETPMEPVTTRAAKKKKSPTDRSWNGQGLQKMQAWPGKFYPLFRHLVRNMKNITCPKVRETWVRLPPCSE
jgi:hypothetical protein